jgi:outer membrane protein assembly factor BamB
MVPSAVSHDGVAYCLGGRSGVVGLAVRTGGRGDVTATHRLWTSTKGSNVSSPVYHDGHLYWMNDASGTAYCVKADTGAVVYEERVRRAGGVYASALLAGGRIYYVGREGRTYVVAAVPRFDLLATNDLGDRSDFDATPVAVDGRLFIRSNKALYCIGAK